MTELHIGFDDTDSQMGMCTTFVVNRVIEELNLSDELIGYPELIRLNPTVPWKTRGNGALCIRLRIDNEERVKEIKEESIRLLEKHREESSNSGIVFFEKDPREIREIKDFSMKAVKEIVNLKRARELIKEFGESKEYGNGQGIVGALSACGHDFIDHSYEYIAYRLKERWGSNRFVDKKKVKEASKEHYPSVWDNFDWENNELVFSPNTPCPVLYGVRGDNVPEIISFKNKLRTEETYSSTLFKTNQGTDEHLQEIQRISDIKPFTSVIVRGEVKKEPYTIEGGHVFFSITDGREEIDCAAYEPTKEFRNIIRELIKGDEIKVIGGVRKEPLTINLEKIEVIELAKDVIKKNPVCPNCGKRMESAGKNQGYRCRDCKTSAEQKKEVINERELKEKKYEVPPTARRHLSKPLIREEKK